MPIKLNLARIDALEQLRITDLGYWNIWTKYFWTNYLWIKAHKRELIKCPNIVKKSAGARNLKTDVGIF